MDGLSYDLNFESNPITISLPDCGESTFYEVILPDVSQAEPLFVPSLKATRPMLCERPLEADEFPGFKQLVESTRECHSICCYAEGTSSRPDGGQLTKFALKFAVNVNEIATQGWVAQMLVKEAQFYASELVHEQGRRVPIHYGVWSGQTSWGGRVMVAILEWGGVPWSAIAGSQLDTQDRR
jgi:hypothetical protein